MENRVERKAVRLSKKLDLLDVFSIASGAMISSGLFILPGLAHAKAGPAVVISYLLGGLFALPGMLSIAEMTTAMPRAGGDCFAIIRSMGPAIGTVAGLLSWFSLCMKSAFALVGMSVFAMLIMDIDVHITAVSFGLVFLIINLIGIREAGRTQVALVAGLLVLMLLYVVRGIPAVKVQHFEPFAPQGLAAIFSTAGFVFVSYAGLLKIASVSEEIKNPGRVIPLGMIISLLVVMAFYIFVVFVTTGVLDADKLHQSLTPISDGASVFMGSGGRIVLSVAAILAFLSTANAGIMTAARSLVPLSRDRLFPEVLARINAKFRTPHNSLLLTGVFILVSLFLKLEVLVEAASVALILTNILSCGSVIILRESRLQNYQPTFRMPFYPWIQIGGIAGLGFLLLEMGREAMLISLILSLGGFLTYWFYGRIRGRREYALVHLIERMTAKQLTSGLLESELREIIRERDDISADRFDMTIESSIVLDIDKSVPVEEFFQLVADAMSKKLKVESAVLAKLLLDREKVSSTIIGPGLAIPHIVIQGENIFDILLARCREGVRFAENIPGLHAIFVLVGTRDKRNFYLRALSAIAQIVRDPHFEKKWLRARNKEALRDIVLLGERRRDQMLTEGG